VNRPFADGPLPFGKLYLWQPDYREFCCSVETFEWLAAGGMRELDGFPVVLQRMDTLVGGFNVMVKVWDAVEVREGARELQVEAQRWVTA